MSRARDEASSHRAAPAAAFVDSVGVNVHMGFRDTPYARTELVRQKLRELGVRHVRDALAARRPELHRALRSLADSGVALNLILGDPAGRFGVGTLQGLVDALNTELSGSVASVEGPNEYDGSGDPAWATRLRAYQAELYRRIKSNPELRELPVVGPSFIRSTNRRAAGDMSGSLDRGNLHPYPGGMEPERNIGYELGLAERTSGEKAVVATETGYHNALTTVDEHPPTSERAAAVYLPRLYLEYFRRGIRRTFAYELLDEHPDPTRHSRESNFGLLHRDFSEKPAFKAISGLLKILDDTAGAGHDPDKLAYTLEGGQGLRRLLLQKGNGTFYLALWQPAKVWDERRRRDLNPRVRRTTLQLEEPVERATLYRPARSSAPFASRRDTRELPLQVAADVLLVKLEPKGESALDVLRRPALELLGVE